MAETLIRGGALCIVAIAAVVIAGSRSAVFSQSKPVAPGHSSLPAAVDQLSAVTPQPLSVAQQDCLQRTGLDVIYGASSADRRQGLLRSIQDCVDAISNPRPAMRLVPPTAPAQAFTTPRVAAPRRAAGSGTIIESGDAPSGGGVYHFVNEWTESTPNAMLYVLAGAMSVYPPEGGAPDRTQGVVNIFADPTLGKEAQAVSGTHPTPSKHGPVRIVDAIGEVLALRTDDGTMFYFDVNSRQYVPALPALSGTPTPAAGP